MAILVDSSISGREPNEKSRESENNPDKLFRISQLQMTQDRRRLAASPIIGSGALHYKNAQKKRVVSCSAWLFEESTTLIGGVMIRSYQGIRPTVPESCYIDESAQVIG